MMLLNSLLAAQWRKRAGGGGYKGVEVRPVTDRPSTWSLCGCPPGVSVALSVALFTVVSLARWWPDVYYLVLTMHLHPS